MPLPTLPRELVLRIMQEARDARQLMYYHKLRRFASNLIPSRRAMLNAILDRQIDPNVPRPRRANVLLIRETIAEWERNNRGAVRIADMRDIGVTFVRWYGMAYGNTTTQMDNPYARAVRRRQRR